MNGSTDTMYLKQIQNIIAEIFENLVEIFKFYIVQILYFTKVNPLHILQDYIEQFYIIK